jgi:hypothetical protein
VSILVGRICSVSFGCGEEVAMFGVVVKGSDVGCETEFSCISFRGWYILGS